MLTQGFICYAMNVHDGQDEVELDASLRLVSLRTVGQLADAHPTTVRRWLRVAEIKPVVIGRGRAGAIRYRWREVCDWLNTLERAE